MVRTQIAGAISEGGELMIFEPNFDGLEEKCLLAPETLTNTNVNNSSIVLVLENHGCEPIYLEAGQMLGCIYNATVCPEWEVDGEAIMSIDTPLSSAAAVPEISVNTLFAGPDTNSERLSEPSEQFFGEDSRVLKLLNALTISESNLTVDQLASLRDLVVEYSDVFALDMSELGLTDLVSHTINTGDNPPIRQPVRRTPFALRKKMEELVQNMMEQGVIQHSNSPWASPVVLVEKRMEVIVFVLIIGA